MKPKKLFSIGLLYFNGSHCYPDKRSCDYAKAFEFFIKAASMGQPDACLYLGKMYANGLGVERDYEEARKWYHKADEFGFTESRKWELDNLLAELDERVDAEKGDASAMKSLADKYSSNPRHYQEAIRFYEMAVQKGDEESKLLLQKMHDKVAELDKCLHPDTTPNEYARELMKAAEAGDKEAQLTLGLEYLNGDIVKYNPSEAARLIKMSATPLESTPEIEAITKYILEHDDRFGCDEVFKAVYKPDWHDDMLSFYFNSHDEEDLECWGGDLILVDDGIILIQCSDPFKFYLLSECSEPTIQNILAAIEECEED